MRFDRFMDFLGFARRGRFSPPFPVGSNFLEFAQEFARM